MDRGTFGRRETDGDAVEFVMSDSLTVLFTSAGRRVELLQCFRADAAALGIELRVMAADLNPELSTACHLADRRVGIPAIHAPDFVTRILELCAREGVRLLVPLHEFELPVFAAAHEQFRAAGVHLALSSAAVVTIARDKLRTARTLAAAGIPTPRTDALDALPADLPGWSWPVIVKPIAGMASQGVQLVDSYHELGGLMMRINPATHVVQERIHGREFTVNVFVDRRGQVRCAVPHHRLETRAGEVSKGRTERHDALGAIAQRLSTALPGAYGALCFQAIVPDGSEPKVFEINARFGGGYPLAHRAGATFPRWLMEDALGRESTVHDNWRSGVLMLRHDVSLFLET